MNSGHYWPDNAHNVREVDGIKYAIARHLVHNRDPEYGGDIRWLNVDADDGTAEIRYYDVGDDEEGTLATAEW